MLHLLLRYTQALITQMTQTAVCNRHHLVEQQLCRWLLLSLDRLPSASINMTQELTADMLVCDVRASLKRLAACSARESSAAAEGISRLLIGPVWNAPHVNAMAWRRWNLIR